MKETRKPIRVLIAKPGLDGHDRGAKVVTLGLRNEGMEVIYTGIRQTAESIAETAVQEGVDVVGLSCLSGAHSHYFPRIAQLLREKGMTEVLIIGGGIVPEEDIPLLKQAGIEKVFGPGSSIKDIANFITSNVRQSR